MVPPLPGSVTEVPVWCNKKLRDTPARGMNAKAPLGRRAQELAREQKILSCAIEELALSDYGGLTIDAVAARAGVNKTTVYRKWPTKAELIRAALESVIEMIQVGPSAGDLRTDLLRIARACLRFVRSNQGQSIMRLRLLQHPEPELAKLAKALTEKQLAASRALFAAAAERGEIARDVDEVLLLDMLWGAIHARVVMRSESVDDRTLQRLADLLLNAVRPGPRVPGPASPRRASVRPR